MIPMSAPKPKAWILFQNFQLRPSNLMIWCLADASTIKGRDDKNGNKGDIGNRHKGNNGNTFRNNGKIEGCDDDKQNNTKNIDNSYKDNKNSNLKHHQQNGEGD